MSNIQQPSATLHAPRSIVFGERPPFRRSNLARAAAISATTASAPAPAPAPAPASAPAPEPAPAYAGFAGPVSKREVAANDEVSDQDVGDETNTAQARAILRGVVGRRLVQARTLSGLSQTSAAQALGYVGPAQLSQWEKSRRLLPLGELIKASRVYNVPVDFLLGESADATRDPAAGLRHATLNGVRSVLEQVAVIVTDQVARHADMLGPTVGCVSGLVAAGQALQSSIDFVVRQDGFDELLGGARLLHCSNEFAAQLDDARRKIELHNRMDSDVRQRLAAIGDAASHEDDDIDD